MYTDNLKKIVTKRKKRIGRGAGSGKGMHTVGKGQKGQTSRAGYHIKRGFEGGQNPLSKSLPRFRGVNASKHNKPVSISITAFIKKGEYKISLEKVKRVSKSNNLVIVGPKSYEDVDLSKVSVGQGIVLSKSLEKRILDSGGRIIEE